MMEYTIIRNYPGTDDEPGQINWRKRFGRVQVRCPRCDELFNVPKDVKFNKDGQANTTTYHFCEDSDGNDDGGWVALLELEGWGK